jgi:hypothetical protein
VEAKAEKERLELRSQVQSRSGEEEGRREEEDRGRRLTNAQNRLRSKSQGRGLRTRLREEAATAATSSPISPAWGSGGGRQLVQQNRVSSGLNHFPGGASPLLQNLFKTPQSVGQTSARNASSPGTELGPVGPPRSPGGPGALIPHSPTTSSTARRGSASIHPATPLKTAHSSTSIVSSSSTLVSQEINDKQDGKLVRLTLSYFG